MGSFKYMFHGFYILYKLLLYTLFETAFGYSIAAVTEENCFGTWIFFFQLLDDCNYLFMETPLKHYFSKV